MKHAFRVLGYGIGAIAAAAVAIDAWAAGVYKWIDDHGVVHYSDQEPAEAPAKGTTVLDTQGRSLKKIDPPLTPEQQRAKADEDARQHMLDKAKDDQARKDKALMQSYSNEGEIDIARARAVSTIEAQIKSAQVYSADLTRRQQGIATQKASFGGKAIPSELEHESATVDSELSRQLILIRQKQEELSAVANKYDAIKRRWHEILAEQQRAALAADAPATARAARDSTGKPMTAAPAAASSAGSK